jgi:hypothetical protein
MAVAKLLGCKWHRLSRLLGLLVRGAEYLITAIAGFLGLLGRVLVR